MSVDDVVGRCRVVPKGYPTGKLDPELLAVTCSLGVGLVRVRAAAVWCPWANIPCS